MKRIDPKDIIIGIPSNDLSYHNLDHFKKVTEVTGIKVLIYLNNIKLTKKKLDKVRADYPMIEFLYKRNKITLLTARKLIWQYVIDHNISYLFQFDFDDKILIDNCDELLRFNKIDLVEYNDVSTDQNLKKLYSYDRKTVIAKNRKEFEDKLLFRSPCICTNGFVRLSLPLIKRAIKYLNEFETNEYDYGEDLISTFIYYDCLNSMVLSGCYLGYYVHGNESNYNKVLTAEVVNKQMAKVLSFDSFKFYMNKDITCKFIDLMIFRRLNMMTSNVKDKIMKDYGVKSYVC